MTLAVSLTERPRARAARVARLKKLLRERS